MEHWLHWDPYGRNPFNTGPEVKADMKPKKALGIVILAVLAGQSVQAADWSFFAEFSF